jgi:hypothetical protein
MEGAMQGKLDRLLSELTEVSDSDPGGGESLAAVKAQIDLEERVERLERVGRTLLLALVEQKNEKPCVVYGSTP